MAGPSALVVFILLLLLAIAGCTYFALVWRETSARRAVALAEWAQATGFYFNPLAKLRPPRPFERFGTGVRIRNCLVSSKATVVEFSVDSPAKATVADDPAAMPSHRFNVLVWPVESDWPAIALRPAAAATSLSDILSLPSQAARFGSHRFVIHTDHRTTGKHLADSRVRGLLPADIGLLLLGRYMILDFSCRPFDGIEFNRMIAIAQQVLSHLPAAK
ncbi:hypothetical protein [Humisphaera borealis]|uniref:Uncharacterized protein n=1 Tax=Humisphaera borealis TaxID=2807512 RepID=A0A7M2WVR4_9BACT|nr:hypothetical protein [Humisphaera borealis]QOV88570.1 hypothetical protein IPV69_20340 [Humisphaera borealis]